MQQRSKRKWLFSTLAIAAIAMPQIVQADDQPSEGTALKLDEIVVTGTKTAHSLQDTPVTTFLITEKEIAQSNAKTAGEAMAWVPGVYVKPNGFARPAVYMEGLPNKYTLVLIDGQRQTGRHGNAVDLANIPAEMIERIEVIKGPASVLYGSDAVAGVVNVITKKTPDKAFASGVISYGNNDQSGTGDTVNFQTNFGERLDKLSYTFGVGSQNSNQMGDGYEYQSKNGSSNFQYDIDGKKRLFLNLNAYTESSAYLDDQKFNSSLGFESSFGESSNLRLTLMNHRADRTDIRPGQTPRTWDYNNYAGEGQFSQLVGKANMITLGGEYRQNNLESTEVGNESENLYSGFLQDEIALFDKAVLVMAGRVDHHELWGYQFNPKGSLLYDLTRQSKIRLNAGRAFVAPTLDDIYKIQPHLHVNYWIVGNPDIKPETSDGYSLDLEHNWSNKILGRVSFFRNDIKDMISSKQEGAYVDGFPVMKAYNINKAFSQGYEVELQYSPMKSLLGAVAYTYTQMEDKAVGKQIQNMPKHTAKMNAQYDNDHYKFGLHGDVQYLGKMYTDSKLTVESRDYVIANAKLSKELSNSLGMFVAVDNVFNEVPPPENSKYFNMGRMWTLGLNFRL